MNRAPPSLRGSLSLCYHCRIGTFSEIETAADSLPSEEKEELLRFLDMRLRKERTLPKPRICSDEELAAMTAEDEADSETFRQGR